MTSPLHNVRVHGLGLTDDFLLTLSDRAQAGSIKEATPKNYDLPPRTTLDEAVLDAWDDARRAWAKYETHGQDVWNAWLRPLLKTMDYQFTGGGATSGKYSVRHVSDTRDVPLHFTSAADLDKVNEETGVRVSPHGLMQGYLNATPEHLWGMVTNGEVLRILRDNNQVTRPAYAEFRLSDIMNGEDARGFRVLWLLLHRTRLKGAKTSLLELWNTEAGKAGVKARDSLRDGVARAIELVGSSLLQRNPSLGAQLASGQLTSNDLYRTCLKLIYQMVFVFVVEDRGLLFARNSDGEYLADAKTRERAKHYLTRRLRDRATAQEGSIQHTDAFDGWQRLVEHLRHGFAPLGLPALGSELFKPTLLDGLKISNREFLSAVRELSEIEVDRTLRPVNYAGLDSEELGSIYESLLEYVAIVEGSSTMRLISLAGNDRKSTGSYYTPTSLIDLLLESALDPVIGQAVAGKSREDGIEALKKLRVIDPACGSGHFLIAAARRIAMKLAELQEDTSQPSPEAHRRATRTVITHCVYGSDINPMAIELAKVALWLESQDAGKPLAFLDHRLRLGNALLGTSPDLMNSEDEIPETTLRKIYYPAVSAKTLHLPDKAFTPLDGDNKATAKALEKLNKAEREQAVKADRGLQSLGLNIDTDLVPVMRLMQKLDQIEPDNIDQVHAQEEAWQEIEADADLNHLRTVADAWCAAFVLPKVPGSPVVTTQTLHQLTASSSALPDIQAAVRGVTEQYRFLHSHLDFMSVMEQGGFDCVLGNPPWKRTKLQEKKWFAQRVPAIAGAKNKSERERMITELKANRPEMHAEYQRAVRETKGESHLIRSSGRYPLTGRGDINTYSIFSEALRDSLSSTGRMGIIVPTGIATDDTTKFFFQSLMDQKSLVSLYDFENRKKIFPAIDSRLKFSMLTVSGRGQQNETATFAFFLQSPEELTIPEKVFPLSSDDIALFNPNTRTSPIFRTVRDVLITKGIYQRVPVLWNEAQGANPWGIKFKTMFHMASDSKHFENADVLEKAYWELVGNQYVREDEFMLPLYEAKLMHQFDHRFATYDETVAAPKVSANEDDDNDVDEETEDTSVGVRDITAQEKANSGFLPQPRYWLEAQRVDDALIEKDKFGNVIWEWSRAWLMGFRDITNSTNERTGIFAIEPRVAVGHTHPLLFTSEAPVKQAALLASLNSFVVDYAARQKIGGTHLTYGFLKQFPALKPDDFTVSMLEFITPRVLELTFTAQDLAGFAHDLGYGGNPFVWDSKRRFWLRAELDALFFHLYGIERKDVDYIMETFPIVKKNDLAAHQTFRTKEAILSIYDQLGQLGLNNLALYVSQWDVNPELPLGPEAQKDDKFRQAILNTAPSHSYITKIFHQTRVYTQRTFAPRKTVQDWEAAIVDSAP